jgi:hypothetical protein
MYMRLNLDDTKLVTGEKVLKLNHISTVATWKVLRLVERGVEGAGVRITRNEECLGGMLFIVLCLART